jgi:two-component system response regulator YesN
MEPVDLLRILQRCKAILEEAALHAQEAVLYKNQNRIDELQKWINGEYVHFDRSSGWLKESFVIVVWKPEGFGTQPQLSLQMQKAKDLLVLWCEEGLTFIHGEQQLITVLSYNKGHAVSEIQKAHQRLLHQEGICFTVGISESVHERVRISDAYHCALKALEQAFFEGIGKCFIGKIGSNAQVDPAELYHPLWKELKERFSKGYADANREQCELVLKECCNLWLLGVYKKSEIISQARSLATIIWSRDNHLKTDELVNGMLEKLQQMLLIETLPELQRFMSQELSDIWEVNKFSMKAADSGSMHAIQLSLSYIQENYRGELSLQDAADHVHMSRNYYSEQFKRVMGLNFIDFVIRLRIHYAMQLLRQTNLKVYDIGEQAGFHSSKHFLKLFKRVVNCTPAEFRQKQGM